MSTMINQEGTITLIDQAKHEGCRVLASSYLQEVLLGSLFLSLTSKERGKMNTWILTSHSPRKQGRNTLGVGVFLGQYRHVWNSSVFPELQK